MPTFDERGLGCAVSVFASVALLSAASGGYAPQSWGWAGLGAACVALVLIALQFGPQGPLPSLYAGLLVVAGLWSIATAAWSISTPSSILDAQRHLVVAGGALAAVTIARRQDGPALRLGLLAAISLVCAANLVHRVQGGEVTTGADAAPIGYANGLGIMAAVGCLLALEAGRSWRPALLLLPLPALVLFLSESTGAALALAGGAAVATIAVGGRVRLAGIALLLVGAAAALAAGSFSGHLREYYWAVAWEGFEQNPIGGSGAGTFAHVWALERTVSHSAQDAHSLYLETLSEQGPVGLLLLTAALALPLFAGRGRERPFAVGAYAAAVVHAGGDWDWELTAVALTTVLLGASLLVEASRPAWRTQARPRWLVTAIVLAAASSVTLVGAVSLDRAQSSFAAGRLVQAEQRAARAAWLAPWSTEVARVRVEILLARGKRARAREIARSALDRDPRDWRLWLLLARASEGADRERALVRARSLNPLGGT